MARNCWFWCTSCKTKAYRDEKGIEYGHLNKCEFYIKHKGVYK